MKLSIIIPVYNAKKYLKRCLDNFIEQIISSEMHDAELITVDDGSTDGSSDILRAYADKYAFVRYVRQHNAGPASARNSGYDMASGEWIYYADPDDYPVYNAISEICKAISTHATADVIIFDAYEHNGHKVKSLEHFDKAFISTGKDNIKSLQYISLYPYMPHKRLNNPPDIQESAIASYPVSMAAPWDKIYRHTFLSSHGLRFNEDLRVLDDMYYNMEVFGAAAEVVYLKIPIYHYIHNQGTITSAYSPVRIAKDRQVWNAVINYIDKICKTSASNPADISYTAELNNALYKRIVKSYAIALKLSVFNPSNNADIRTKVNEAKLILNTPEYSTAFKNVHKSELEWRLKPIVTLGRLHMGYGLYILTMLNNLLERI